jgi:hypothetical protein
VWALTEAGIKVEREIDEVIASVKKNGMKVQEFSQNFLTPPRTLTSYPYLPPLFTAQAAPKRLANTPII